MKNINILNIIFLVVFLLSGCAKNMLVLVPDPNGKVGKISITNKKGSQTLSKAYHAIYIKDENSAPSSSEPLSSDKINKIFKDVILIEPASPIIYVLFFKSGTTELQADSLALIPAIMKSAKKKASRDISVIGHTDRKGKKDANLSLSLERAMKIKDMLECGGIEPEIIRTTSHGEGNPLIKTPDNVAEPKNRCVEVIIR